MYKQAVTISRSSIVEAARSTVLDQIGNTPLIRLRKIASKFLNVEVYAKAEWMNPSGSIKDRPVLAMIRAGEISGDLTRGKTLIDATSGNAGIAYAMIASAQGHRVKLVLPANVSSERKRTLQAYGAELVFTDPLEGSDGAIRRAREIYESDPDSYYYPDQYNNDANWQAHYETTGREILEQTEGRVTHFVAGVGTGGTLMGVGRRLREHNPSIKIISVEPNSPLHGLEGLKHMATSIVPGIYDVNFADGRLEVKTEDAQQMVRRLAREEGLLVGLSAGAAMFASLQVAAKVERGVLVAVFPDGGYRYLGERFWTENGP